MTGIEDVLPTDKIVNKFKWNAIWIRDGIPYSVNHFPKSRILNLEERVEIRYELYRLDDFENLKVDPASLGYTFLDDGYRVGSDFDRQSWRQSDE